MKDGKVHADEIFFIHLTRFSENYREMSIINLFAKRQRK